MYEDPSREYTLEKDGITFSIHSLFETHNFDTPYLDRIAIGISANVGERDVTQDTTTEFAPRKITNPTLDAHVDAMAKEIQKKLDASELRGAYRKFDMQVHHNEYHPNNIYPIIAHGVLPLYQGPAYRTGEGEIIPHYSERNQEAENRTFEKGIKALQILRDDLPEGMRFPEELINQVLADIRKIETDRSKEPLARAV